MKEAWKMPRVFAIGDIGDDTDISNVSGQSGFEPYPCTFQEWLKLFAEEGYETYDDYVDWWEENFFEGDPYPENPEP